MNVIFVSMFETAFKRHKLCSWKHRTLNNYWEIWWQPEDQQSHSSFWSSFNIDPSSHCCSRALLLVWQVKLKLPRTFSHTWLGTVMLNSCMFADFNVAWALNHPLHNLSFAWPFDSCFLLPLPAFTCALTLSAGRTGQQDDLLPEFDVEIMPGTAAHPHFCLTAWCLLASLLPPNV